MENRKPIKVSLPKPRQSHKDELVVGTQSYREKCICHRSQETCHDWVKSTPLRGPNGILLKLCAWHSGGKSNAAQKIPINPLLNVFTIAPSMYSVWYDDLECYDQCWKDAESSRKLQIEKITKVFKFIDKADDYIKALKVMMRDLNVKVEQRDLLKLQSEKMRKESQALQRGPNVNDPRAQSLRYLEERAEKALKNATENAEKRWGEGPADNEASKIIFVKTYTSTLVDDYKKAQEAHSNWINKNTKTDAAITKLMEQERAVTSQYMTLVDTVKIQAVSPYFFARMLTEKIYEAERELQLNKLSCSITERHSTEMKRLVLLESQIDTIRTELEGYVPSAARDVEYSRWKVVQERSYNNDFGKFANIYVAENVESDMGNLVILADGSVVSEKSVEVGVRSAVTASVAVKDVNHAEHAYVEEYAHEIVTEEEDVNGETDYNWRFSHSRGKSLNQYADSGIDGKFQRVKRWSTSDRY